MRDNHALTDACDRRTVGSEVADMSKNKKPSTDAQERGLSRAAAMTPEQRSESAKYAAQARWADPSIPKATHRGVLTIGNVKIPCAVLGATGKRVLSENGITLALLGSRSGASKRRKSGGSPLPMFLAPSNLKPFISDDLTSGPLFPITYRDGDKTVVGFDAEALPAVCEVWLKARDEGALQDQQLGKAKQADILMRALAHVGIIALVDEATGYQAERARDELQKILAQYIAAELLPWTRRFPNEFFKQIYRVHGWKYEPGNTRGPRYVGKIIKRYIYEKLPPGVLLELEKKNPPVEGRRRFKHFQWLTEDTGHPHLDGQILKVTTLLQVSDSPAEFVRNFKKAFPQPGQQTELNLSEDEEP